MEKEKIIELIEEEEKEWIEINKNRNKNVDQDLRNIHNFKIAIINTIKNHNE